MERYLHTCTWLFPFTVIGVMAVPVAALSGVLGLEDQGGNTPLIFAVYYVLLCITRYFSAVPDTESWGP